MRVQRRSTNFGFTLLENILALGIFVVAITGVMTVLAKTMELVKDVRAKQTMEVALNAKLAERSRIPFLPNGERRLKSELPEIYFKESVRELNLENQEGEGLEGLKELELSIFRDGAGDTPLQTVTVWMNASQVRN